MFARRILPFVLAGLTALPVAVQAQKPAPNPTPGPAPGATQPAKPAGPKQIGKFGDWTAATHQESSGTVCYAFVRAQSSAPAVANRGEVVLTVTQRVSGRDAVALAAGFVYAANATVTMQVDQIGLDFYTAQRNAFARDGKAAVAAFQKGSRAIARSPGPRDTQVTDTFSLNGFSAAYQAISKECPAR